MSSSTVYLASYLPYFVLLLRLFLGAALTFHGFPKFMPQVRQQLGQWMNSIGIPSLVVPLVTINEFFGGIFLILGLIVPVVSIFLLIQFVAIVLVKKIKMKGAFFAPGGPESRKPEYEVDLLYAFLAITLLFLGAGPISIDSIIGLA